MEPFIRPPLRWGAPALALALLLSTASTASAEDSSHRMAVGEPRDATPPPDLAREAPFLDENSAAMTKMMQDMAVPPTGDVDRDFVAMMVPHHQGAIDMALAVLRYGHNEQLKRLAQEIIVTQQQEIAAMRLAVGEPLPPSAAAPTQPSAEATADPSVNRGNPTMPAANMNMN